MYRPTKAYISLRALRHNLNVVKAIAPNSKVFAVIKANGYGHGITRVAQSLNSTDGFAVASLEEALVLRQKGFLHRILLLEGVFGDNELALIYQHRLDLVVHSHHQLIWLLESPFESQINVWIKIDTGMHRLGFALDEVEWVIDQLQNSKKPFQIHLMSHLAAADESEVFTEKQITLFNNLASQYDYPKSLANSAGLQNFNATHYDWVRPGIMLYGSGQDKHIDSKLKCKPVMTLASEITALKWVSKGEFVGYGNSWQAPKDTYVAIVAIGYGDGYPRHAPVGTPIIIQKQKMPLIGRVSMDMICVDVTKLAKTIRIGDEAILWGNELLSVDEVAELSGTIGYELLCGITPRVPIVEVD